jgi:phosphoribosyl 1,2-cyclic phosphate phosphodiesterase
LIIKFLGTGTSQGIPVIGCTCKTCISTNAKDKRLRSSVYIENEYCKLIIDTGPDLRQQLLQNDVTDLDGILITHEHNDHTAGLDDVRPINFKHQKSLPLYSIQRVLDNIKVRFPYIFDANPYPGAPKMDLKPILPYKYFDLKGTSILPIEYDHGQLKVIGFRIKDMAYVTDVSFLDEQAMSSLQNLKVLIISALQHSPHNAHFSLNEAIEVSYKINATHTYFMHMSHTMGPVDEWSKDLPERISAAYDGLLLDVQ